MCEFSVCIIYIFFRIDNPEKCPHRNWFGLKVSFAIYIPYTILFAKLFIDSYLVKPKPRSTAKSTTSGVEKNGAQKTANGDSNGATKKHD